jgi:hypothetical protein
MATERYNGWTNRPTWAEGLWLGNDEETYNVVQHLIRRSKDNYEAAEVVKGYVEDNSPLADEASLYSDLLG